MTRVALAGSRLPLETYASILNVLEDRSEIKTFRLSIPLLGLWSLKPLFVDVAVSLNVSAPGPDDRLRFLAGLPATWIRDLEIRCFGAEDLEMGLETKTCLQRLVNSRVLKSICFMNFPVGIAEELLGSRKEGLRLDVVYIVMHERDPSPANETDEYEEWLEVVLALPDHARPKRVNAGWGWVPERLPVEQMRLLSDIGTICEPLFD